MKWKLAPEEPTDEMALATLKKCSNPSSWVSNRKSIYRDMIAAAPQPEHDSTLAVWISVTDRLPESGKPVLVSLGKKVLRAAHAAKFSLDEENWGWWNDGEGADYNEANDMTYWPEGWYEWNEHEECHWQLDNEPTHWMQLPEAHKDGSKNE